MPAAQQMLSPRPSRPITAQPPGVSTNSRAGTILRLSCAVQSEVEQQTEPCEATSCAGLCPPGSRDPDVSLDVTAAANERRLLRPGDQSEAGKLQLWSRSQRLNASRVTRCDGPRNLPQTAEHRALTREIYNRDHPRTQNNFTKCVHLY